MATKMKNKDIDIKKKQAADAIAQANIDREMMSKRNDRPLPKAMPKPAPKVVPMPTDVNRDEMRNADLQREMANQATPMGKKCGGSIKAYKKGGSVKSSASSRADGCAQRGKTRGRFI